MGGARTLIASLGASISLVAGAAVSLLLFSFVFAFPGLTGASDAPATSTAVVVASRSLPARPGREARAAEGSTVLISAPKRARAAARPAERRSKVVRREVADVKPSFDARVPHFTPPPPATASPTPSKPQLGKGVKDVGDVVTATVKGTGAATAPLLGPPVSQVVQDLLDLLSSVLQGTTNALGGALDKAVPR
jgi:hypothetical protein